MNEKLKWVILAAVFLGIGFLAGRFLFVENGKPRVRNNSRLNLSEIRNKSNYKFINPLLECDNANHLQDFNHSTFLSKNFKPIFLQRLKVESI
jgi:hypothetical protein